MRVTIFGSGYVGLVTGACLADAGNDVLCVDVDQNKVDALKRGEDGWQVMQRERFITAHECSLLQAAQRAGNLPWVLKQLAESIERRFDYRLGQLGETLQPVFVLCVGVTVLLICVSIFFPFIQLVRFMPGGY